MQVAAVAAGCPVQAAQRRLAADARCSWGVPGRVVQGPGCSCSPQRCSPGAGVHSLGSYPQRLHSKMMPMNAADAVFTWQPSVVPCWQAEFVSMLNLPHVQCLSCTSGQWGHFSLVTSAEAV